MKVSGPWGRFMLSDNWSFTQRRVWGFVETR